MVSNFLWAAGNNGYITPAPLTPTGATSTSTSITGLSPTVSVLKGTLVTGSGIPTPDFVTTTVTASSSVTLTTATTTTLSSTTITFQQFPILIGGEASALANGSGTVTSSYWNGNGVFRQSSEFLEALYTSIFFQAGGAFTPTTGGVLTGWWLPSFDGGNTFELVIATASTTVAAISRSPDFIIPLDAAAHAAGTTRWASGRLVRPPPEADFKVLIQNNSGATLPSVWAIGAGPATVSY